MHGLPVLCVSVGVPVVVVGMAVSGELVTIPAVGTGVRPANVGMKDDGVEDFDSEAHMSPAGKVVLPACACAAGTAKGPDRSTNTVASGTMRRLPDDRTDCAETITPSDRSQCVISADESLPASPGRETCCPEGSAPRRARGRLNGCTSVQIHLDTLSQWLRDVTTLPTAAPVLA